VTNGPPSPDACPVRTDTRKSLWYSGLHTLGTSLIATPLMVAGGIILARALGPAGKGGYDLVIATTALLEVLLDFSLPAGVIYVVAKGDAAPGSLALRLLLIAPCQGLAAGVLLFFLQHTSYSAALLPPHMKGQAIAAVAISLIFTEFSAFWRAILFGLQEIIKVNRLELISKALFLLMLVAMIGILAAMRYRPSAALFVWVHVALLILTSLMFLYSLFPFLSRGETGFRELVVFAFPCYLANFSQFLNFRLDVFMVSYFIGVEGVGLYTLAVNLAQVIWLIPQAAAKVLLPKVAASQEAASENAASTAQITRITLWVGLVVALFLAVFARFMLPVVYGEAFRRSVAPFLLLLPGIVVFSTVNVLTSYIAGIGKPQVNLLISLAGLVFTLSLDFLLIPRFNIVGAAIASTVSYSISAALTLWFFRRQARVGLRDIVLITSEDLRAVTLLLRGVY
jgi:O-antigen/teichoic acid export membrane protein